MNMVLSSGGSGFAKGYNCGPRSLYWCRAITQREWIAKMSVPARVERYIADLPLLHSWDRGKTWNTGGFMPEELKAIYDFARENRPVDAQILETGAGNSTIVFLLLSPARVVSIAPKAELFERIRSYCARSGIAMGALTATVDRSEWALPKMAMDITAGTAPRFDFILIDGNHNWPMVFVDFFYTNFMLKTGGFLMIDDTQLHSVKELARMLLEQPEFRLEKKMRKSMIFRRIADAPTLRNWEAIPSIVRLSGEPL